MRNKLTEAEKKLAALLQTNQYLVTAWGCSYEEAAIDLVANGVTIEDEDPYKYLTSAGAIAQMMEMQERAEKMRLLYEGVERGEIFVSRWIPVSERLPENGEVVQIWCGEHQIARFNRGISAAEREKMKRGEMENPKELGWSLSTGYIRNKRSDVIKSCDEWGNNTVPYNWESTCGPMKWFGQTVTHWKPKDELPKGE